MSLADRARLDRGRVDRAGALLLLLLVLGLVWVGPVSAYRAFLDANSEEIAAKQETLARYRRLVGEPVGMSPAAALAGGALLFPAVPDSQAVALLQETVKSAAAAARVQVQGLQVLQGKAATGAVRIGVRVRASGDVASLGRLLYAVEAARPMLYPDNLQIQARPLQAGGSNTLLDFQLDVSGFKTGAAK